MICRHATAKGRETVKLEQACRRVAAGGMRAEVPQPQYTQSLRDGYAIAAGGESEGGNRTYRIEGEIFAGCLDEPVLTSGSAYRIMTGARTPVGSLRVIPQEICHVRSGVVSVPESCLAGPPTFIQERGSEIGEGEEIVGAQVVLRPEEISLLATTGCSRVEVWKKPRVAFFCTGSELVATPKELRPGLKVSANRYLLGGLLADFGAEIDDFGIIPDTREEVTKAFRRLAAGGYQAVVSTGGMGPGKYDLVEEAFQREGGTVLYNALSMSPGKSTMFGLLDNILYFGLPGPPHAVRILLYELVAPALFRMQGLDRQFPLSCKAVLEHDVPGARSSMVTIKEGMLSRKDEVCSVRMAGRREHSDCFVVVGTEQRDLAAGEVVEVHLTRTPFNW